MKMILRESACREAAFLSGIEASDAIKDWLAEEHACHPFILEGPVHRMLECELKYYGFTSITVSKMETHDVFILKGKTGNSGCNSEAHFERLLKELARGIGLKIRAADAAISYSRGRFRAVLCL